MILADTPSLGLLLGLPLALLTVVACAAGGLALWRQPYGEYKVEGGFVLGLAVVVLIGTAFVMWPWKYDYHFWVDKQGRAEKISKRLVSNGDKGMSERYVIVIDGQPFGVDDTRASLLKVGDTVKLRCKKEHQMMQEHESDGWACRWGGVTR